MAVSVGGTVVSVIVGTSGTLSSPASSGVGVAVVVAQAKVNKPIRAMIFKMVLVFMVVLL
jgi:hypothetical protein